MNPTIQRVSSLRPSFKAFTVSLLPAANRPAPLNPWAEAFASSVLTRLVSDHSQVLIKPSMLHIRASQSLEEYDSFRLSWTEVLPIGHRPMHTCHSISSLSDANGIDQASRQYKQVLSLLDRWLHSRLMHFNFLRGYIGRVHQVWTDYRSGASLLVEMGITCLPKDQLEEF